MRGVAGVELVVLRDVYLATGELYFEGSPEEAALSDLIARGLVMEHPGYWEADDDLTESWTTDLEVTPIGRVVLAASSAL